MADRGIKVMLDGYDVTIGVSLPTDIQKFALLTSVSLLKIKQVGKVNISGSGSTTVAHGLSYKPLFWVFFVNGSGEMQPAYHSQEQDGVAFVDSTNLNLSNRGFSAHDFYYYIFYDPA